MEALQAFLKSQAAQQGQLTENMILIGQGMEKLTERIEKMGEAGAGWRSGEGRGVLEGKSFEMLKKYAGGETEWHEWSGDFRNLVETRSDILGEAMGLVKKVAKKDEKEALGWKEVKEMLVEDAGGVDDDGVERKYQELAKRAKELYRWLRWTTEDEAKLLVLTIEDEADGVKAWGLLNARYSKKTLTRMMRHQQECVYPKEVKTHEVVGSVMAWEDKWKKMLKDQPGDTKIPELWKMAAMLKLCPKEIRDMVELRWDEIGERYEVLKERVIGWATQRSEKRGGAVPMEVDFVDGEGNAQGEWTEDPENNYYGSGMVGAVYPQSRCYFCQGYGHFARECPMKGKGKGREAGGKGGDKGKGKGTFDGRAMDTKGVGVKGVASGKPGANLWGKGGAKGWDGKGGAKSRGKGFGYQGTCWRCGEVGHKANECEMHWVQCMEEFEDDEGANKDVGGVWVVAAVDEETSIEKGSLGKICSGGYQGGCRHGQCGAGHCRSGTRPLPTLEAWMPKKVEVANRFKIFQIEGDEEDEDDGGAETNMVGEALGTAALLHERCGLQAPGIGEVVEITVDSGAARSVWPMRKKGVKRTKIQGKKPKLAAASGTEIGVEGEAVLEFEMEGKMCGMKFLDADVKKPLGAVSAMVDEGNTVVFSRKWGSYVENDETKQRIPMERSGGTYVMKLRRTENNNASNGVRRTVGHGPTQDKITGRMCGSTVKWHDGKEKTEMEVGGVGDDEEVVFRRRTLP